MQAKIRQIFKGSNSRQIIGVLLATVLAMPAFSVINIGDSIINAIDERYGNRAVRRVVNWEEVMVENQDRSIKSKLEKVNRFFNRLRYRTDIEHWGIEDYWATPLEMLGTNHGDCEDYSIAKYFTLLALGVPDEHLRLTYVNAVKLGQAHMVLTYYGESKSDPLVLDNLEPWIRKASKRRDLVPVYNFNGSGLWLSRERGKEFFPGGAAQIEQWADMIERMPDAYLDSTLYALNSGAE